MSKNIQNEDSNEIQTKAGKAYSLRHRNASKKNSSYSKFSSEQENESSESLLLKKKRKPVEYSSSSNVVSKDAKKNFMIKVLYISIK